MLSSASRALPVRLPPYQVHELYLFFSGQDNTYIDISETIELKAEALQCHVTQFGPDANLLDRMKDWFARTTIEAKEKKSLDVQYAEGFRSIKLHVPKDENKKPEEL